MIKRPSASKEKLPWEGRILSIQPRIRMIRTFNEKSHVYHGYVLSVEGVVNGEARCFTVGIKKSDQRSHGFQAGYVISGESLPIDDANLHTVDYFKTSRLKVLEASAAVGNDAPPWLGPPAALSVYRERGQRRLDPDTYAQRCTTCVWGCSMPVEIIMDLSKRDVKEYRTETFCFGPKSCSAYEAGERRVVPGRRGTSWVEPDAADEEATAHRGPDE